ncbi:hypothetical protein [Nostoc sp.]|uniref:hypothetical protein n=1 Tax=Nostoc sp. TaxID=1180 RepID=UPI002FF5F152
MQLDEATLCAFTYLGILNGREVLPLLTSNQTLPLLVKERLPNIFGFIPDFYQRQVLYDLY